MNNFDQPDEILDIVNENDEIIGTEKKGVANSDPKYTHREVGILIFDDRRRVLLQQRGLKKKIRPGCWTVSAAGHVSSGHSYEQTAHRELLEELGFDTGLVETYKEFWAEANETKFGMHFIGKYSGQKIVINPGEVEQVRFFSKEEFDIFFLNQNQIGDWSRKILNEFWEGKFDHLIKSIDSLGV